jgi:hypothetical protein
LGVGRGAKKTLTVKNKFVTKRINEPRTWTDFFWIKDLFKGIWTYEIWNSVVDWIGLAQDRYRWRALVNSVMYLRVP